MDTKSDGSNCGACGTTCTNGQVCSNGACALNCAGGSTKCGTSCIDTSIDTQNCGACGNACAAGNSCVAGKCELQCSGGTTKCGGTAAPSPDAGASDGGTTAAPYCTLLSLDDNNCGACGTKCGTGTRCGNGKCCGYNQTACNGTCTDIVNNDKNCGGCGIQCGVDTPFCSNAVCIACPAPATVVNGVCSYTHNILNADLSSLSCGGQGTARYAQVNGGLDFVTIASKAAIVAPKSATLRMNGNVQCTGASQPFDVEVRLGADVVAVLQGGLDSACQCASTVDNQVQVNLTAAQAALYAAGTPLTVNPIANANNTSPLYGFTSLDNTASNDIYGTLTFVY